MADFDIDEALTRIREAVRPFPKAAMFALRDAGYATLFEQVVACLLSVRTYDEVSLVAAQRLFAAAREPAALAATDPAAIDAHIGDVTFHERKAVQIRDIARITVEAHGGVLPCDDETIRGLPGIGPKCANLALGIACGLPRISVDIHVHRVTNRWGYVATRTPEQTLAVLERTLPDRWRVEINALLVPFGKHICTGVRPKCSTCPVNDLCPRIGVTSHR